MWAELDEMTLIDRKSIYGNRWTPEPISHRNDRQILGFLPRFSNLRVNPMCIHSFFAKSEPSLETRFRKAYEHAKRLQSFYFSVDDSLWNRFTIELRQPSLESPEEYYRSNKKS